jgi:Domain of unknown function (DUF4136)
VRRTLFFLLSTCLVPLATLAQSVYVDYNHNLNFSQFRTYAWGKQDNPNQIMSPFLAEEAQNQVNMQLQAKGLMLRQENEAPDLIVVASGGIKPQTSYNMWGTGGWRWGGGTGSITPDTTLAATLVVDLYDANNKQLAWRGVGQGSLNQGNSNKNRQLVDKAVTKMFQKYPSPAKQ